MRLLILLGAPGAGKGTHAIRLAMEEKIPHISTGDLLREEVRQGTELGRKAKGFMDAGQLVPDGLILAMLEQRLNRADCEQGALLDGFPRTIAQAEALDRMLPAAEINVLALDVPDDILLQRLSGRLSCAACGAVFHTTNAPPQRAGICDRCHGPLHQREDDREETIKKRISAFHAQTAPLSSYYEAQEKLHLIRADQPVAQVYHDILSVLKALEH